MGNEPDQIHPKVAPTRRWQWTTTILAIQSNRVSAAEGCQMCTKCNKMTRPLKTENRKDVCNPDEMRWVNETTVPKYNRGRVPSLIAVRLNNIADMYKPATWLYDFIHVVRTGCDQKPPAKQMCRAVRPSRLPALQRHIINTKRTQDKKDLLLNKQDRLSMTCKLHTRKNSRANACRPYRCFANRQEILMLRQPRHWITNDHTYRLQKPSVYLPEPMGVTSSTGNF